MTVIFFILLLFFPRYSSFRSRLHIKEWTRATHRYKCLSKEIPPKFQNYLVYVVGELIYHKKIRSHANIVLIYWDDLFGCLILHFNIPYKSKVTTFFCSMFWHCAMYERSVSVLLIFAPWGLYLRNIQSNISNTEIQLRLISYS